MTVPQKHDWLISIVERWVGEIDETSTLVSLARVIGNRLKDIDDRVRVDVEWLDRGGHSPFKPMHTFDWESKLWVSLAQANSIGPSQSGDVQIMIEPGTYRSYYLDPRRDAPDILDVEPSLKPRPTLRPDL